VSKPLRSLLTEQPELRRLLDQAHQLAELHRQFAVVAPDYLAQSSQILGLQLGTLSVAVANPTLAAKLRQLAPDLVTRMQQRGCEISSIRVKVQVSFDFPVKPRTPRQISSAARDALRQFHDTLPDTALKNVVGKLAKS
jgi:hypothetical protein